jgi:pimeloyl-ACP methyl ester carboxylesterase
MGSAVPLAGSLDEPPPHCRERSWEVAMHTFRRSPLRTPSVPRSPLAVSLVLLLTTLLTSVGCERRQLLAPETRAVSGSAAGGGAHRFDSDEIIPSTPLHLEGTSASGALWVIDRPAAWNGDLVLYLHGYTNPALPIALPNNGSIRDSLMARGFAVAASSFSANGFAVEEGMKDSRELLSVFREQVAEPRRTVLFGQSLGGLIGLLLAQRSPEQFAGAFLVSGIVGGSRDEIQYVGDIRVLFDAVYPGVLPGDLEHPPVITDLQTQVVQPVLGAVQRNPQGLGIIQSLARHPLPGANSNEVVTSLINVVGFALQGGGDLLERTHGQSYFDNADWRYDSALLPAALVDDVNARVARYRSTPEAEAFLARYGEPSSRLRRPMFTLHKTRDPIVPAFHEERLGLVAGGPLLEQHLVPGYGHTDFSTGELMRDFDVLRTRLGEREHREHEDGRELAMR